MTINSTAWKRMPVAARETEWSFEDAIARVTNWASGSVDKFNSAFLWRDPKSPANNKNSYRLPIADVIGGRLTLIPHAVFSAAAILSGAHGELEGVVGEQEKLELKGVITEIYAMLQKDYGDPRVKPPWLRGGNKEEQVTAGLNNVNASVFTSMPIASEEIPWSVQAACKALWEHADGDIREYRKGFLWWDRGAPDQKNSYKLPIATVDPSGQRVLVPKAVKAMAQIFTGTPEIVDIPDEDMSAVASVVHGIKNRLDAVEAGAHDQAKALEVVTAGIAPIAPPKGWFEDPKLDGPTPIAVTADGRVMGHLAAWGTCHAGIGNQCVMAPRTAVAYKYFRNGSVVTADGGIVRVGKITAGTGHADTRLGWVPASDHYDNTGKQVAVVASGEDRWGIWVAGALVPEADDTDAAMLRRSPLSGDWRRINGNLELVAALAVNTPGFPIVNLNASGEPEALCAAGVVLEDGTIASLDPDALTDAERTLLNRLKEQQTYVAAMARNRTLRRYANLVAQPLRSRDGM